jgi:hypothetical protein
MHKKKKPKKKRGGAQGRGGAGSRQHEADMQLREQMIEQMPPTLRDAFQRGDTQAVLQAFGSLQQSDFDETMAKMLAMADQIPQSPDNPVVPHSLMQEFEPFLQEIAAIANGEERLRKDVEDEFEMLEQIGFHLRDASHRIWQGERDAATLTANLDEMSAALVERVLAIVEHG